MGNKEPLDFSKELKRALGTADEAHQAVDQTFGAPQASGSFAHAITVLVEEAVRLGYTRKEITIALGDAIGRLDQDTGFADPNRTT